jgi:NAD-dependent SIR2 family protein deacetylase
MERAGVVTGVVTQNVDRLHQAAGSRRVVELHGALADVRCLDCGATEPRDTVQERLRALNPDALATPVAVAPDGDADLPQALVEGFCVPPCIACGGVLKPDVVFFGENVPPWRHARALRALGESDAMLVVGSSLMVYSGFRYVKAAVAAGTPVAAVNLGRTRADHLLSLKVHQRAGAALPAAVAELEVAS